ncbi:cardioacceleratory peptide receptor-like isoform X2 [Ostrea edulis]|nr:cardioacceleratory peptide receptor-like isoform X2 [Ostrea edulis]
MTRKKRSRMNIFIANLAIADLMVGFFSVLMDIIEKLTIEWQAGVVMCKTIRFIQGIATYGSTYALVALSIDRLDSIARPLKSVSKGQRVKALIVLQWTFAALFSLPMFKFEIVHKIYQESIKSFCMINFPAQWAWKLYLTLVAIAVFIVPAILIAICYIVIVVIIWRRSSSSVDKQYSDVTQTDCRTKNHKIRKEVKFQDGLAASKSLNGDTSNMIANTSGGLISKAKIKTIKMTFVIVLAFIFCWSPYFVYDFYQLYGPFTNSAQMEAVTTFVQSLAPLNSAANPVIFLIFNYESYMKMVRSGLRNRPSALTMSHV